MENSSDAPSLRGPSKRRVKPARGTAWGILNPWGDVWTHETFHSPQEAEAYLKAYWSPTRLGKTDLSRFRVELLRVTVSALPGNRKDGASPKNNEPSDV